MYEKIKNDIVSAMKEKDTLWPMVGIFVRGAFVILGLMFVLSALVMIFNKGAFSLNLIRRDFKMIFYISLVILLLLFLAIMVMAVFRVQTTPSNGQSMLIKDNTLRYEKDGADLPASEFQQDYAPEMLVRYGAGSLGRSWSELIEALS